jgi:nitrogen fixation protein FixH
VLVPFLRGKFFIGKRDKSALHRAEVDTLTGGFSEVSMKTQTARRPDQQRSARSNKSKKYVKQTAHVEARRDGKPLIFGWGGHLSVSEKNLIKRRAVWGTCVAFFLIIVFVFAGFWININIITPNLPLTSVNGQNVTQAVYRELVAVKAQIEQNKIQGVHGLQAQSNALNKQVTDQQTVVNNDTAKVDNLVKQVNAAPAGSSQKATLNKQLDAARAQLNTDQTKLDQLQIQSQTMTQTTIPNEQQLYTQSQVGSESAQWLQDNLLIEDWLAKQNSSVQAQVEPSTASVNADVKNFIANFPSSLTYSKFLSTNNLSDADVHAMMSLIQRRTNMQNYLAAQIKSPAYQVSAQAMTLATQKDADKMLQELKQGANFAALAKKNSVDSSTNTKGGNLGWLARGQYTNTYAANVSAVVDNWLFDPARKVGELSPVLKENGTYHIVQITSIDPARPIDSATLQSLKSNALTAWLLSQKALPGTHITSIDQNMQTNTSNMPSSLPSGAPSNNPAGGAAGLPGSTGLPNSVPTP